MFGLCHHPPVVFSTRECIFALASQLTFVLCRCIGVPLWPTNDMPGVQPGASVCGWRGRRSPHLFFVCNGTVFGEWCSGEDCEANISKAVESFKSINIKPAAKLELDFCFWPKRRPHLWGVGVGDGTVVCPCLAPHGSEKRPRYKAQLFQNVSS